MSNAVVDAVRGATRTGFQAEEVLDDKRALEYAYAAVTASRQAVSSLMYDESVSFVPIEGSEALNQGAHFVPSSISSLIDRISLRCVRPSATGI